MKGLSVVIPCLNEKRTIQGAVEEAWRGIKASGLEGEVVVADNGSTDGSQALATASGARIVDVPVRGYGAALHYGILQARYDYVLFADADLSYPFEQADRLMTPLLQGKAQFVLGSRLGGTIENGAMPHLNRYIGTPVLSALIRIIYRLPTSDCNSGMRAFARQIYPSLKLSCPGMEYASEMLIRMAQCKFAYTEVPIDFRKDKRGAPPHLKRWRDGWRHLRFILGNASSSFFIVAPALLGALLLIVSFLLSLGGNSANGAIHFHTAFSLIALSMPLSIISLTFFLVRAYRHEQKVVSSRLVSAIKKFSETGAPFYVALALYGMALLQMCLMAFSWYQAGMSTLFEIDSTIRIIVFTIFATVIFCLDLGMGLLMLLPMNWRAQNDGLEAARSDEMNSIAVGVPRLTTTSID